MFHTGIFSPVLMGVQYSGQQPATLVHQPQCGGWSCQVAQYFRPTVPSREQSLPASVKGYPATIVPYDLKSSRRYNQYHLSAVPPRHVDQSNHRSKNKNRPKRRDILPNSVNDQSLYVSKEKENQKCRETPNQSSSSPSVNRSEQDENNNTNNNQEQPSQKIENIHVDDPSQAGTTLIEEQINLKEIKERKSRSKQSKYHYHDYHDQNNNYNNHFQQPSPFYDDLLPDMKVHQQPPYNSYNQAYEGSVRLGDAYHKQAKCSIRLPSEVKQQLLPNEDDRRKQYPFTGYLQHPFADVHPSLNPYQLYGPFRSGFFNSKMAYNNFRPWANVNRIQVENKQGISGLRNHIFTLEAELRQLKKKFNKAKLNNKEATTKDDNNSTSRRLKPGHIRSLRQTPVIVELNSTNNNNTQDLSSETRHRHRTDGNISPQPDRKLVQQSNRISDETIMNRDPILSANQISSQSLNQRQMDSYERDEKENKCLHSDDNRVSTTGHKTLIPPKNSRDETAAAHDRAFRKIPPVQAQKNCGRAPHLPVLDHTHYSNGSYQQQQQNVLNSNYNQANNNELFGHDRQRRNRSAEKILDAFERIYMNNRKASVTSLKVKYIPENKNSSYYHQRNTNNNRYRSVSRKSSSLSTASSIIRSNRLSPRDFKYKRITKK